MKVVWGGGGGGGGIGQELASVELVRHKDTIRLGCKPRRQESPISFLICNQHVINLGVGVNNNPLLMFSSQVGSASFPGHTE